VDVTKGMIGLALALVLLAGCKQQRSDLGNSASANAEALGNAADNFATRADNWGDNASARVDNASEADRARIDKGNDRLAKLVDPGTSTDKLVGRWKGVEGLNLVIEKDPKKGPGHYILHDQYTLDDKGVFEGEAVGDKIRFTRPDGEQMLRPSTGDATGLKWLAGKKDCLTVKTGEGYCRD
jgi:hypothetical protein